MRLVVFVHSVQPKWEAFVVAIEAFDEMMAEQVGTMSMLPFVSMAGQRD